MGDAYAHANASAKCKLNTRVLQVKRPHGAWEPMGAMTMDAETAWGQDATRRRRRRLGLCQSGGDECS